VRRQCRCGPPWSISYLRPRTDNLRNARGKRCGNSIAASIEAVETVDESLAGSAAKAACSTTIARRATNLTMGLSILVHHLHLVFLRADEASIQHVFISGLRPLRPTQKTPTSKGRRLQP